MHNSATCVAAHRLPGHDVSATVADTKGGGKDFLTRIGIYRGIWTPGGVGWLYT